MDEDTNSQENSEKIFPRTVNLEKEHTEFIKDNAIHFSPWVRNIIDKAIILNKDGKNVLKILQDEIDGSRNK